MPLISFKAGRSERRDAGSNFVDSRPDRGLFSLDNEDGLLHLKWTNLTTPTEEPLDLILFPGDATVTKANGRVFVLTFSSSDARTFFWFQDVSDAQDDARLRRINALIDDVDAPEEAAGSQDVEMSAGPIASVPPSEATAVSSPSLPSAAAAPPLTAPAHSANDQLRDILAQFANQQQPQPQTARFIEGLSDAEVEELAAFLPADIPHNRRTLVAVIKSVEFKRSVASFDAGLRTGGLVPLVTSFDLPQTAAMGVDEYCSALKEQDRARRSDGSGSGMHHVEHAPPPGADHQMVSAQSAVKTSGTDRAIVIDDSEVETIDARPELAVVWGFLWHFSPFRDDVLWPQTIDEFERACLASDPPPEFGADAKAPYVPSLVPILEWISELAQSEMKSKDEKPWDRWLKSWTSMRLQASDCRLSDLWGGNNRLETCGTFWALAWQDKLILLKIITDFLLTHCDQIREEIKSKYDIAPGKESIRSAARNPLVVETLGKDARLRSYWQIDDTARIFESGNPYRMRCPMISRTHTEADLQSFARSLSKPATPPKLAPIFITKQKQPLTDLNTNEHALRAKLENQVLPNLGTGVKRMQEVIAKREQLVREREEEELAQIRREQQKALREQQREERKARLRRNRTVDSESDVERDSNPEWNEIADGFSDDEAKPKRRRGPPADADEGTFLLVDDPEMLLGGRNSRRSATPLLSNLRDRRGGRQGALIPSNGSSLSSAAYRATRSRQNDNHLDGKLPRGADAKDYDLTTYEDVEGKKTRLIKGSLTATAEIAQQLAEDAQKRVEQLEAGQDVTSAHLPLLPKDSDPADYELASLEDSVVWSRGHEKCRKGALTAAKEVAAQLVAEAERLGEIAEAVNAASEEAISPAQTKPTKKRNVFGRDLDNDAFTDDGAPSTDEML